MPPRFRIPFRIGHRGNAGFQHDAQQPSRILELDFQGFPLPVSGNAFRPIAGAVLQVIRGARRAVGVLLQSRAGRHIILVRQGSLFTADGDLAVLVQHPAGAGRQHHGGSIGPAVRSQQGPGINAFGRSHNGFGICGRVQLDGLVGHLRAVYIHDRPGGASRPGHHRRGEQRQTGFPHVDLRFRRNGNILRIRHGKLEGKHMSTRLVGNLGHQPVGDSGNGGHGGSVRLKMPPFHQGGITFQIVHGRHDVLHRLRKRQVAYGLRLCGIGLFIRRIILERHAHGDGLALDAFGDVQRAGVNQKGLVLFQGHGNVQGVQPDSVRLRQIHGDRQAGRRSNALKGDVPRPGLRGLFCGALFLMLRVCGQDRHAAHGAGQPDQGSQSHGR